MNFLRRLLRCCCCCCCSARVSLEEGPSRGGVPPLPTLPAGPVRFSIRATPEEPPKEEGDPLPLPLALPPLPDTASVLERVAALDAADPRATASRFKVAAASLQKFYAARNAAVATSSSSFSVSSSPSASAAAFAAKAASSSNAAALAAIAEVVAVAEEQGQRGEGQRGQMISIFKKKLKAKLSPPLSSSIEAVKKKPKRVRKVERRALEALFP